MLPLCDNVLVKAAARLGINRNTLHKKLAEFKSPLVAERGSVMSIGFQSPSASEERQQRPQAARARKERGLLYNSEC